MSQFLKGFPGRRRKRSADRFARGALPLKQKLKKLFSLLVIPYWVTEQASLEAENSGKTLPLTGYTLLGKGPGRDGA
jgi:hypothetical protein